MSSKRILITFFPHDIVTEFHASVHYYSVGHFYNQSYSSSSISRTSLTVADDVVPSPSHVNNLLEGGIAYFQHSNSLILSIVPALGILELNPYVIT